MRWPPFSHQIDDLNHLAGQTRTGLYSEPGVGKTLPTQAYAVWLVAQGNKVVATMPPVLVSQFEESFANNYQGIGKHVRLQTLDGTPKQREKLIEGWGKDWPDILLMSYRKFVEYHKTLKDQGYTCVIVDEATAVKSPSSQLHNAVKVFAGNHRKDSNGVVLMTGTPVETNVQDAYGLIAILNPDRYGSQKMFERVHCITASRTIGREDEGTQRTVSQIVGYKNHELLHSSLMLNGRRVLKSQVSDLPPRLITEMRITLGRQHRELYDKMVDERVLEIGDRMLDLTEQTAIYQALQRTLVCPERFTEKEFTNELLESLDTLVESLGGKKVVVYCWYQDSIEKLKERYKALNPAVLYGKITGSRRATEKKKFIEDDTCRMILANPRSGGVGVDGFQHVSSHVIFAEVCPFVGVFQQSIDRLHRTGQGAESVNVYVLVPTNTIAVKLRNDLVRKDLQQELVVKDKRAVLAALSGEEGIRGSLDTIGEVSVGSTEEDVEAWEE